MDYNKIKEAAQNYEADMTKFLRDHGSLSRRELW